MNRRGFSLIEIVVVIAIAGALVILASSVSVNINGLNGLVSQQLQSKSDISQTLQLLTTEIRSASPSQTGAYPISAAASSSFTFYSDIGKNGSIERVRYFYGTSTIWKGVITPNASGTYVSSTEVITDVVDNVIKPTTSTPLFSYYDSSYYGVGGAMTSPINLSAVRIIGIAFSADTKPNQAPTGQSFSILVDIRNLRSN